MTGTVPAGLRIYAVGDVHGRADLLRALLEMLKADAREFEGKIQLVMQGDYIDRGPDSRGGVEVLLRETPPEWELVGLRGNHEEVLAWFLKDPVGRPDWLHWGGVQALESYGVAAFGPRGLRDAKALAAEFEHAATEAGHLKFLLERPLMHVVGDYVFVHAGVRAGVPLKDQMAHDLLFIREDFLGRPHGLPYRVVFGHTILPEVLVTEDRIGLDTGAFSTGRLSSVALENATVRIIATDGD